MSALFEQRLQQLSDPASASLLKDIRRGIEKESLRITSDGRLAQTPHPTGLGSALCNPYITTDYSEALMEFITPVSNSIEATLDTLSAIHRFVYSQLDGELLWGASMPCILEGDADIPVARYGSSNVAQMKTVYRHGLGHRYGRLMQTIAGIHYNFSMPGQFWVEAQAAANHTGSVEDYTTERYLGLIRNFHRLSWLLIYLFGASPAVCKSFLRDHRNHNLVPFDETSRSMHLPYATALRMGDLGYQSNAQKDLKVCYNALNSYIGTLHEAITTSHPDYVAIGTGNGKHSRQLSTSLLQIENEFYSPIRPKRVAHSGEIPLGALSRGGVEYIEVRSVDINPFQPLGIDAQQIRFLDTFLLFCLLEDSPPCDDDERVIMAENMHRVVNRGREPGLQLVNASGESGLREMADVVLDRLSPLAELLDRANDNQLYSASLQSQAGKLEDPAQTPSAQILARMKSENLPFFSLAMACSEEWANGFRADPLSSESREHFQHQAADSITAQREIEAADEYDFESYLAHYYQQYQLLDADRN